MTLFPKKFLALPSRSPARQPAGRLFLFPKSARAIRAVEWMVGGTSVFAAGARGEFSSLASGLDATKPRQREALDALFDCSDAVRLAEAQLARCRRRMLEAAVFIETESQKQNSPCHP